MRAFPSHLHTALLPQQEEQKVPFQRTLREAVRSPESTCSCPSWVSGEPQEGDTTSKTSKHRGGILAPCRGYRLGSG